MGNKEWSGSCDPCDPDKFWIDDETDERVNALTVERSKHNCPQEVFTAKLLLEPLEGACSLCDEDNVRQFHLLDSRGRIWAVICTEDAKRLDLHDGKTITRQEVEAAS